MSPDAECHPDDIVVTGLGTINPLGADVESTWTALHGGTCAVRTLEHEWVEHYDLPVRIGAPLAVDPTEMLSPRQMRRLDRASQCALLAAHQAWEQAGAPQVVSQRLAVSVSPGMGPVLSVMEAWDTLRNKGPRRVLPTAVPALMPNAPAPPSGSNWGRTAVSTLRSRPAPRGLRPSPTVRTSSLWGGLTSSWPGVRMRPSTR